MFGFRVDDGLPLHNPVRVGLPTTQEWQVASGKAWPALHYRYLVDFNPRFRKVVLLERVPKRASFRDPLPSHALSRPTSGVARE